MQHVGTKAPTPLSGFIPALFKNNVPSSSSAYTCFLELKLTCLGLNRLCTDWINRHILNVSRFSGRSLAKIKPHLKANLELISVSKNDFLYEIQQYLCRGPNLWFDIWHSYDATLAGPIFIRLCYWKWISNLLPTRLSSNSICAVVRSSSKDMMDLNGFDVLANKQIGRPVSFWGFPFCLIIELGTT